jgi:hypothetical protein
MTTVLSVITDALADANVTDRGETPSANDSQTALDLLNQMLAMWQVDNVTVYAQQRTSFSPSGALSYAVGTGQTVNMARPARIDRAYWRLDGIDYPITLLDTFEQYESIEQKTQAGEPQFAFYLPSYANGTLYLYPQPSTGTMYLVTQVTLPASNALADTLTLPPEYVLPIRSNLTVLVCGAYQAPVKPAIAATAMSSLRLLKRNNLRIQPLVMPGSIPVGTRSNIISGD